jgi:hypothetical protein
VTKKPPVRRPLTVGFRPVKYPLRNGQEIADALGVTRRRLEQLIAKGEAARSDTLRYPDSIGYLTRDLLPKDKRGRYLPVERKQLEFVLNSVRSQTGRSAQKRSSRGEFTSEPDFEQEWAHWEGAVHRVPTGKPGLFCTEKCVEGTQRGHRPSRRRRRGRSNV